jgi:two-component system, cell cycle response regulator
MRSNDLDTGAYNNGHFQHYLKNELKRAERHAYPISVLMLDIDDFKLVNDRHGHLAGDKLLKEIAEKLRQNMREIDVLARFGGDEFAIVLPYTKKEDAVAVAERMRILFENCAVAVNDQASLSIYMSIGVADFAPGDDTVQDLIQKADKALYTAKFDGKNKVVSAAEGSHFHSIMN